MASSPARTTLAPPAFREGPAPTRADIADVAARVEKRMRRWLRRRGLLDERVAEDCSNEAPELSPLEACMQLSLFGSTYLRLAKDGAPLAGEETRSRGAGKGSWVAEVSGFNLHAGVTVRAGDREGLERLCRYGARPPFSLERLSILQDGRVAYLRCMPRRNGATHLVMTPVQLLARDGRKVGEATAREGYASIVSVNGGGCWSIHFASYSAHGAGAAGVPEDHVIKGAAGQHVFEAPSVDKPFDATPDQLWVKTTNPDSASARQTAPSDSAHGR